MHLSRYDQFFLTTATGEPYYKEHWNPKVPSPPAKPAAPEFWAITPAGSR